MRIDTRLLGWGTFFVLVGAIPLLMNANYLDETVVGQWPSLWPLLLIGWGIALVFRHTPVALLGGAISAVTFGLMGGGALATGFGGVSMFGGCGDAAGTAFATQRGTFAGSGQLNIEFNCGNLNVTPVDGSDWSVSGSDAKGLGPRVTTAGSAVTIESQNEGFSFFDRGAGRGSWSVAVPRAAEVGLGLTLNAGEGAVDLAGASVASVSLTLNAGSLRMDLGSAERAGDVNGTVNAGNGTVILPAGGRTANFSLNAGNLDVCVPTDAAVRIHWSGALGSNDLNQPGLVKVDSDTWASQGFDAAQPHTEMNVSANAGSFHFAFGSGCNG